MSVCGARGAAVVFDADGRLSLFDVESEVRSTHKELIFCVESLNLLCRTRTSNQRSKTKARRTMMTRRRRMVVKFDG